ncbi:MAG: Holliday junction resolvase RuvX [Mycoplasma sp.]|nr:Holliday junction resolvase RuvX [Mycoplasma sp.]
MRLLAIDFGTKKCGIAISDPLKIISQPLTIIFYKNNDYDYLINQIKKIIEEYKPIEKIILGITKNINNEVSTIGKITMKFKSILEEKINNIEIVLFDEKYSTKKSLEIMQQMNIKTKKKGELKDAIAAQKILEDYMSSH